MPKFLLSLSLLVGITLPAHADTIYHNFFTVVPLLVIRRTRS
jgi:hypothetical protein